MQHFWVCGGIWWCLCVLFSQFCYFSLQHEQQWAENKPIWAFPFANGLCLLHNCLGSLGATCRSVSVAAVPGLGFDSQCYCLLGLNWNPAGKLFTNGGFSLFLLGNMTVNTSNLSSGKLFNQSLWSFVSVRFHTLVAKFLSLFVWGHCEEWPLFVPAIETSVSYYIYRHKGFLLFLYYCGLNIKVKEFGFE